mmetsp:Transcript_12632/g.58403  ORF Transcript_12632/g.58403 Transcript_12632/m.58403 type:complete len:283 (-) Transcript_12632:5493-6341(-)
MNMSRNSRLPTLPMATSESMSAEKRARSLAASLRSLKSLPRRNVRSKVAPGPISWPNISGSDPRTTTKSNLFHGSLKYLFAPRPVIFSAHSITNIHVKKPPRLSWAEVRPDGWPSCVRIIMNTLKPMQPMMNISNRFHCTSLKIHFRMKNTGSRLSSPCSNAFCFCFIFSASAHFCCPGVVNTISPVAAAIRLYVSIKAPTSRYTQNSDDRRTNAMKNRTLIDDASVTGWWSTSVTSMPRCAISNHLSIVVTTKSESMEFPMWSKFSTGLTHCLICELPSGP